MSYRHDFPKAQVQAKDPNDDIELFNDRSLLVQILKSAAIDARSSNKRRREYALEWIHDTDDYEYSFYWMLSTLAGRSISESDLNRIRSRMVNTQVVLDYAKGRYQVNADRTGIGGRYAKQMKAKRTKEKEYDVIGRQCKQPRCATIHNEIGSSYCAMHKQEKPATWVEGKKTNSFYSSSAWRRTRLYKLGLNPICEQCKDRPGTDVHHIIPLKRDPMKAHELENLQALCKKCHSKHIGRESAAKRKANKINNL